MELHVVINGRKDLAGQLYNQLRSAIESGRLAAGTQLPPSRLLAEQLGISRKTISDTYAQLTYENFLTGVIGKGTYVNARPAKIARKQSHTELASYDVIESWRNLPVFLRHPTLEGSLRYDFIGGATSKGQFPQDDWRRCTSHALRQIAGSKGFYSLPEGLPALRNAIARHIAFSRGVNCQDEDVVVCNGAQQALDLISRVMTRPGSIVAMEDPGYPPARLLFDSHGATVIGVPVDAEGIQVDKIPLGTRLIYVTPSHQFPLGLPMSQERRVALLERAYELGAIIIEDDYDSEFRYEGRPTDSLQSMDERGIVAYVGTFSKTLLPELRNIAAGDSRSGDPRQATHRPTHVHVATVGAGQIHRRGLPAQAYPALPYDLCRASRTDSGAHGRRPVAVAGAGAHHGRVPHGGDVQSAYRSSIGDRTGKKSRSRALLHRGLLLSADAAGRAVAGFWRH
jgi:GntR family transcriptional regulator/MocR family aminotransferase